MPPSLHSLGSARCLLYRYQSFKFEKFCEHDSSAASAASSSKQFASEGLRHPRVSHPLESTHTKFRGNPSLRSIRTTHIRSDSGCESERESETERTDTDSSRYLPRGAVTGRHGGPGALLGFLLGDIVTLTHVIALRLRSRRASSYSSRSTPGEVPSPRTR